jgi:hypothetical protein
MLRFSFQNVYNRKAIKLDASEVGKARGNAEPCIRKRVSSPHHVFKYVIILLQAEVLHKQTSPLKQLASLNQYRETPDPRSQDLLKKVAEYACDAARNV